MSDASHKSVPEWGAVILALLPPDAVKVFAEMREGWGHPIRRYAADAGVPDKRTREIVRAFAALGWAEHHQFFSEDDNYIRGSGYSLTSRGAEIDRQIGRIERAKGGAK